ncbi:PucR family transcriptional regulator [Virgibacillus oceani]
MNIQDTLATGELVKGQVAAGKGGLAREVTSIEVMEVPEVMSWASPGVLVVTTFYSIKEDRDRQIDIVRGLIDLEAAGIVIKLGRFVEVIPQAMKQLADTYDFPIITIPKDVSYIEILTPLNEKLYKERQWKKSQSFAPLQEMEQADFSSLHDALEKLTAIVQSPIYLEDSNGKLLYTTKHFLGDEWRKDSHLFSLPTHPSYADVLKEWREKSGAEPYFFFQLPGSRKRIILPLFWDGELFAFLHIIFVVPSMFQHMCAGHMRKISSKLSHLFMMDQVQRQKVYIDHMEQMQKVRMDWEHFQEHEVIGMMHFHDHWLEQTEDATGVIDYGSIMQQHINQLIERLQVGHFISFVRRQNFFAMIFGEEVDLTKIVTSLPESVNTFNEKEGMDLHVSVSFPLNRHIDFDSQLHHVMKTMEMGLKFKPEKNVYTFDQLGMYEILLTLTSNEFVTMYAENVLHPLKGEDALMETLKVYLDENGNISRVSELLFIHRRTLNYRIEKIEESLNMDLKNAEHRFILKFCTTMRDLL